jgi:thymidylate synthase (FAD)
MDKSMNAEQVIAYCARVSSPDNQDNHDTAPKLLAYCIKNGHWSVFEMADMTVEIKTSLAIATQILRHKSMNFQQFSARYAKSTCEFEDTVARAPHPENRQLSQDTLTEEQKQRFKEMQQQVQDLCVATYEEALSIGVAKEVSRFLLPQSTSTVMYMKGSVRSWLTYFMQRLSPATQLEHREVAKAAYSIFLENFPVCAEALRMSYPGLEYP